MFQNILESVKFGSARKISETGLLSGVHLLGLESKNGYKYAIEAITDAHKLYEGVDIYLNHADPSETGDRDVTTKIGFVTTTYVKEAVGMLGDVQFNTEHPHYPALKWWVENQPNKIGFSHIAEAKLDNSTKTMVAIRKPKSVDIVSKPATTNGIFKESFSSVSEGIIEDKVDERRTELLVSAFNSLYWELSYNQGKALTQDELAVKLAPVVQDLLQELTKTETTKESEMDYKDIKIEDLKASRADLVSVIASEAVQAEKDIDAKVVEATKDLDDKAKSKLFMTQVRESVVAGKDLTDLIADRKEIFKIVVESHIPAPRVPEATAPKFTEDTVLALINKK